MSLDLIEALTTAELRTALSAFMDAVDRADRNPHLITLLSDLNAAVRLTERLAYGECEAQQTIPRSYLTPSQVIDIRSAATAREAAERLNIPLPTVRCIRAGRSHKSVGVGS